MTNDTSEVQAESLLCPEIRELVQRHANPEQVLRDLDYEDFYKFLIKNHFRHIYRQPVYGDYIYLDDLLNTLLDYLGLYRHQNLDFPNDLARYIIRHSYSKIFDDFLQLLDLAGIAKRPPDNLYRDIVMITVQ